MSRVHDQPDRWSARCLASPGWVKNENVSQSDSSACRCGRGGSIGRLVAAILLLTVLAAGVWLGRAPLLRGAADLWIVSDPVTHADAVAVLGGGLDVRPFAAAELYKKGLVTKVLVSQVAEARVEQNPRHSRAQRTQPHGASKAWGPGSCH